ncbi:MAG TPA: carbohydrate-binding domain-containing protein, partial [Rhodopila sp.]
TPTPTPTPAPTPTPTHTLTLAVSQDALPNNARFIVKVDGEQVGGTLVASALHGSGDSGLFILNGHWGSAAHDVQIRFLNGAAGPSTAGSHLYINDVAYDGAHYSATPTAMLSAGSHNFAVAGSTPSVPAAAVDRLTLHLSEDAWRGNAQFKLTIDGKTITTPQAITARHCAGQWQDVAFIGDFGAGSHKIGVVFTNDAYGGTATTDRNLYVNGIDVNGKHYGSGVTALMSQSAAQFTVTTPL